MGARSREWKSGMEREWSPIIDGFEGKEKTMKKINNRVHHGNKSIALLCAFAAFSLAACGDSDGGVTMGARTQNSTATVNDLLQAGLEEQQKTSISTPDPTSTPTPTPAPVEDGGWPSEPDKPDENAVLSTTEGIDIDLTILSSTMVYAEVYDMMSVPENYLGKIVKMEGQYSYMADESKGVEYHACIIKDATACCSQGLEFVPNNPEACPVLGESVTVVGTFDIYFEDDYGYITLRNAQVL
ncbi:MAG: hypothetical protein K6E50_07960 [Lachnospiraceae bacterium]|nr:hypothetical protein [Lachnospiraceae bacterium]